MPSQTIHIPEEEYRYILETKEDTLSGRAAELISKGIEFEERGSDVL